MLEKLPASVGRALRQVRAGQEKVVSECAEFAAAPQSIAMASSAFADGEPMPARYTADGEKISPPLTWRGVPTGARSLVLIVEDPDAPALQPLVHLLVFDLPPDLAELPEGMFKSPRHDGLDEDLGRNSYLQAAYLPPDPPTGHGPHRYVFQVFALNRRLDFDRPPGRAAVIEAMRSHVLAKGVLTATYERS
jgi:Raf kinase inhibitor-like YbhB/YbcL family protein